MIYNNTHILLGMKKRGFGQGRWNGFGGKLQSGESIEDAVYREVEEEAGITAVGIKSRGILNFYFENNPEFLEVHVFSTPQFLGTPKETEEMNPAWFPLNKIPFSSMWPDDKYWIKPFLLKGKNFHGDFNLKDQDTLTKYEIKEIPTLVKV